MLWFAGTAVVTAWLVFRDPRMDYRLVALGALAPAVIDALAWLVPGAPLPGRSVVVAAALGVVALVATIGRRRARRRVIAVVIGWVLHLVFAAAWSDTATFWWPLGGAGADADRPAPAMGVWTLPLELVGAGLLVWCWFRWGLSDPVRRRRFWRGEGVEVDAGR